MNLQSLERLIDETIAWYCAKGKIAKRWTIVVRVLMWALASVAVVSMAVGGASTITVVCIVVSASAYGLDRVFAFTRNWIEFSLIEVKLRTAASRMEFRAANGASEDQVLAVFDDAMKAVENETSGWKQDVAAGLENLKRDIETMASK